MTSAATTDFSSELLPQPAGFAIRPLAVAMLATPILIAGGWFFAYSMASNRGGPQGDTTFAWLPIVAAALMIATAPFFLCLYFMLRASAHGGRWIARGEAVVFATLTSVATVITVVLINGMAFEAASLPRDDGYPSDALSLTVVALTAMLSLVPVGLMWLHIRRTGARLRSRRDEIDS